MSPLTAIEAPPVRRSARLLWLGLALLLVVQYALFRHHVRTEVAWAYPPLYDQTSYLTEAYDTHERIKDRGLAEGLRETFVERPLPNGVLFNPEANALFAVLGVSRLSALTVNFLHLALLEAVVPWTLWRLTGRRGVALLGLGLLLTASSPTFVGGGGLTDFRLDFSAYCLFGVFCCLLLRTRGFASLGWSLALGAAGAACVLSRFITSAYVGVLLTLCGVGLGAGVLLARSRQARRDRLARLGRLLLCGALLLTLCSPFIWLNGAAIRAYYARHVRGDEYRVRQQELGVNDAWFRLTYYPWAIRTVHAGTRFVQAAECTLAGAALIAFLGLPLRLRRTGGGNVALGAVLLDATRQALRRWWAAASARPAIPAWLGPVAMLGLCVAVPVAVLTADPAPSVLVGGIVVPPLAVGLALCAGGLAGQLSDRPPLPRLFAALAVAAAAAGVACQVQRLRRPGVFAHRHADVRQVMRLHETLVGYSDRQGWRTPGLCADFVCDAALATVPRILAYERDGAVLNVRQIAPADIMEAPTAALMEERIRQSDFVILMTREPEAPTQLSPSFFPYPFNVAARRVRPDLIAYCEANLDRLERVNAFGGEFTLYARRTAAAARP